MAELHGHARTSLSLSHDGDYAIADVTAEADTPLPPGARVTPCA
jgi:phosphopantetheinyl transferase (holo-ACP synthase)